MNTYIYVTHIHVQRRGPKQPLGLASSTPGQPLKGNTCHGEHVPVSDLRHSTGDAVFQGREPGWLRGVSPGLAPS